LTFGTLRGRFVAYLIVLHAIFASLAVLLLIRHPYWLFAAEVAFAASLGAGIRIGRGMFRHLGFAAEGLRLIREQEFTSRFLEVGQPEIDELIAVYNRMVDNLREERTRLREQHHFLGQILAVSPSGVVILDFDRRVSDVNPAAERLLARPAGDLIGRPLETIGVPLADALAALAPGGAQVITLSGARRVKCHHGTFLDRGFPRSFRLIEELTEELRQSERGAYEKLIRVMSHEVNNSLAAANSLLHSCLTYSAELSGDSRIDFERAIGVVIQRTEQLNSFMRRFAAVFRLPPPLKQPADLVDVLERIVRLLSARAEASRISWQWRAGERPLGVAIDRGQMEQALLNVVQNAVEAAAPEGTITIHAASAGGRVRLMIDDSGAGISPEAQANLFTPFFSTKPHGQGIGLTLVQEVLAAHGCDYALERVGNETTRFTILF
jgi:nitrogen fixation/metabolism regulation signal transduction histidine kinase